mmetsp:Transcript_21797/g.58252  ORF Transcript_21797/g.58252 Transcript_21797/m.58252 type:complete len:286 (+) Transcript_21797:99-956(+)
MPIDYSKFDGIGDDDDEDDRRGGGYRGGGGGGGGADFEQLLQQCLQQAAEKEGKEPPDLLAAAGLGGGPPPPPPISPPPPPPPPCGAFGDLMGLGALDPLGAGYGDEGGLDGLDSGLGASRCLDVEAIRAEAWRIFVRRLVSQCAAASAASVPRGLLLEAEVHILAGRYRQALVAAYAVQLATADATAGPSDARSAAAGAADRPYGEWTAPTLAIEMICSYQLGDRDRAVELRTRLQSMDRSMLSEHLAKRFAGTSEVLELVPQFLEFLQAADQEQKDQEGAGNW